jgi:hypothetical protein
MSQPVICDVCEEEIDQKEKWFFIPWWRLKRSLKVKTKNGFAFYKIVDVCGDCVSDFHDFARAKKDGSVVLVLDEEDARLLRSRPQNKAVSKLIVEPINNILNTRS